MEIAQLEQNMTEISTIQSLLLSLFHVCCWNQNDGKGKLPVGKNYHKVSSYVNTTCHLIYLLQRQFMDRDFVVTILIYTIPEIWTMLVHKFIVISPLLLQARKR